VARAAKDISGLFPDVPTNRILRFDTNLADEELK
jgi:hypothetical protein